MAWLTPRPPIYQHKYNFSRPPPHSERFAAVDRQRRPMDMPRLLAAQKQHGIGDVGGLGQSTRRNCARQPVAVELARRKIGPNTLRIDMPRRHADYADASGRPFQ